jgi:hypothetical protein
MKHSIAVLFFILLFAAPARIFAQTISAATITPALLLSFTGQSANSKATLNWVMEDQTNCKYFAIERTGEEGSFDSIDVVTGINNDNQTNYTFTDTHMLNGNNYYRLRQVDKDGVTRYSKVVTLDNAATTVRFSVYPNPAAAVLHFAITSPAPEQVTVQVYNLAGIVVMSSQQELSAGNNQQSVAISGLKSGNYFLKITSLSGASRYVQPFVKIM